MYLFIIYLFLITPSYTLPPQEEIYAGVTILIMASCQEDFLPHARIPAGYGKEITRINHGEQNCEIAIEGYFKGVSSHFIYEYFVLSKAFALLKEQTKGATVMADCKFGSK